ncbi:pilus assembly protein Flp/PilA [Rhodobium orientis]|uniref:Flp family type IVb pilin n=1 Tax=Rhodobium orientis TaxID=34017 RepID=A0A327JS82_9HYPH|nr:Flp family type IVb pilin [Rhodobium orientis]MBB4304648.1 pilus assembly protein Flp/PilA [Rhodobium orientis]MBK5950023.1 Flp family type IVb pilin [Rhodobium orientis]RAI27752.1 Flp family type IVb pilin [Rhodobium orientis]
MKNLVMRFVKDEEGATAIEYGLIAALIAVGIITAATTLGDQLSATFDYISSELASASVK